MGWNLGACQITRGTNNASGKRNNINKIGYQMLTPSEEKRNLQFPLLGGHELLCYQFKPISREFTYTLHTGFIGDTRSWPLSGMIWIHAFSWAISFFTLRKTDVEWFSSYHASISSLWLRIDKKLLVFVEFIIGDVVMLFQFVAWELKS